MKKIIIYTANLESFKNQTYHAIITSPIVGYEIIWINTPVRYMSFLWEHLIVVIITSRVKQATTQLNYIIDPFPPFYYNFLTWTYIWAYHLEMYLCQAFAQDGMVTCANARARVGQDILF